MFLKLLKLLGLTAKVNAIEVEMDAMRDTLRDANTRLRAELGLDAPQSTPRGRRALAGS